jgi:hypothetical protein
MPNQQADASYASFGQNASSPSPQHPYASFGQNASSPSPQHPYASFGQNASSPFQANSPAMPNQQADASFSQQYPYNLLGNDNQSATSYASTPNPPAQQNPYSMPATSANSPNPNPSSLSISSKLSSFANLPAQQNPYGMPATSATATNNEPTAAFLAGSASSVQNSYSMPASTGNPYPPSSPFATMGNPSTSPFGLAGNTSSAQSPYSMSAAPSSSASPFENNNNIPGFSPAQSNVQQTQSKKQKKGKLFFGIIALIAVLVIGSVGAATFMFINNTPSPAVTKPVPDKPGPPSGKTIVPAAATVIANPQISTGIDNNYQPTNVTKTFTTQQTVYVTFNIDSKKQPGYIEAKWYGNSQFVISDKFSHDPKNNVAYFTQNYSTAQSGAVELYWCTKPDCSDEQLAQVVKFTVTAGSFIQANSVATTSQDIDRRAA